MEFITVIKLILLWGVFVQIVDSATLRNKESLDTPDDETGPLTDDEENWRTTQTVISVDTLNNGVHPDHRISKENVSLEHDFKNTTLPPFLCWEKKCPDCSKLESPQRCFTRGLLQVTIRSLLFCLVLATLLLCVLIINHKWKVTDETKSCKGEAAKRKRKE